MIKVTIFNEHIQDRGPEFADALESGTVHECDQMPDGFRQFLISSARAVAEVHPNGINSTLADIFNECNDLQVRTVTQDMPECGLTEDVLTDTDVLVWWAHVGHEQVPDEIAQRVRDHVLRGMGFVPLHSSHPCKALQLLLGTSGSLKWREGDFSRVWTILPSHPIAQGVPEMFELDEEMYSERFDIPQPDELVFISWFRGGEVFRSGCVWYRGLGRIFYFQPGHETNRSYYNPTVRQILKNAVHWAAPMARIAKLECPHVPVSPEADYQQCKNG